MRKSKFALNDLSAFAEFKLRNTHQIVGGSIVKVENTPAGTRYPNGDHVEHTYDYEGGTWQGFEGIGGGTCPAAIATLPAELDPADPMFVGVPEHEHGMCHEMQNH